MAPPSVTPTDIVGLRVSVTADPPAGTQFGVAMGSGTAGRRSLPPRRATFRSPEERDCPNGRQIMFAADIYNKNRGIPNFDLFLIGRDGTRLTASDIR